MIKTTQAPIDLIYYGSAQALQDALAVHHERIAWAFWMLHKGRAKPPRIKLSKATDDGAQTKDHLHVLIQFNGRVSTDLVDSMLPPDIYGRSLIAPKADRVCRSVSDWILYQTHQDDYIVDVLDNPPKPDKYGWDDFGATDYNILQSAVNDALDYLDKKLAKRRRREAVQDLAADESLTDRELLRRCRNHNEELTAIAYRQAARWERNASRELRNPSRELLEA